MKMKYFLLMSLFAVALTSCIKDQVDTETQAYDPEDYAILKQNLDLPLEAMNYDVTLPNHLGGSSVNTSKHQATLGRVLFYDTKLSKNESISCATCHLAERAFAEENRKAERDQIQKTDKDVVATVDDHARVCRTHI